MVAKRAAAAKKKAAPVKKAVAKKAVAKKSPAKKAAPSKPTKQEGKAMLYAPAAGSALDVMTRIKAVIAILDDAPVSQAKAKGACLILTKVLEMLAK